MGIDALELVEKTIGPMTVGRLLRVYRNRFELDQKALAKKLDVTVGYVSNIETGKKHVTLDKLMEICETLGQNKRYWMTIYFEEESRRVGSAMTVTLEEKKPKRRA